MVTAILAKKASLIKGNIPKIVVAAAKKTGRIRLRKKQKKQGQVFEL